MPKRLPLALLFVLAWALPLVLLAGCSTRATSAWAHEHHSVSTDFGPGLLVPEDEAGARVIAGPIPVRSDSGFTEAVLSFNASVPDGAGLVALVQVTEPERLRSDPLRIASWGAVPDGRAELTADGPVRVMIDELIVSPTPDAATATELAVSLIAFEPGAGEGDPRVRIDRLDVVTTRSDRAGSHDPSPGSPIDAGAPFLACPVTDDPELSSRLCSPTSLSMLLAHRGANPDYQTLIETILDPVHDLYGVWPRAIQTAYVFGVPGRLHRFGSWEEVREHLTRTGPIAISITAPRGTLRNAPYRETAGHLIVLTGLTAGGDAVVLDPAVGTESEARRIYTAEDLSDVWLDRKRGTAYVLLPASD